MIPDSNALNWIIAPAFTCVKYIGEETINASVLHRSIINVDLIKPLLKIARQKLLENGLDDSSLVLLEKENELLEQKAKELISSNFHSINSHGLVGLWCAVETAVEDTVVLILMNDAKCIGAIKNAGYKIKFDFNQKLDEEMAKKIYANLERQVRKCFRVGEGYCTLLSIFGLQMQLDNNTLNILSEINSVRNCILHRGGIIDSKAGNESQRLANFVDKEINISNELYLTYYRAAGKFASALLSATTKSNYIILVT